MPLEMGLGTLGVALHADATQFERTMKKSVALLNNTANAMQGAALKMSLAITAPLTLIGKKAVDAFASFDKAMTESTAIMTGLSSEMRNDMEQLALQMSTKNVQSATELANSYYFLASAGLDASQSMAALPVVTQFATAGAFNMAEATDLLTDAQSALGLSSKDAVKNQTNMLMLSDMLVRANTLANASVRQFSESLTNEAAASMKSYNIAIEDGIAVLAAYADQGIKGLKAGSMFSRLTKLMINSVNENAAAFKKLNINVKAGNGDLRPYADIIGDVTNALKGMGATQKAAALQTLGFQADAQAAILPLLGSADAIRKYAKGVREAGGFTEEVANNQLKSFSSQMAIAQNHINVLFIGLKNYLAPILLTINEYVKAAAQWWQQLAEPIRRMVVYGVMLLAVLGPTLFFLSKFVALGGMIAGALSFVAGFVPVLISAVGAVLSFGAAILAVVASPIGLLIAAIGVIGVLLVRNTEAGVASIRWLGDTFQWWADLVSGLVGRFLQSWEGVRNALTADDLALGVQVLWAQIKMEWASGINELAQSFGWLYDQIRDVWRLVVMTAAFAAESVAKGFWTAIESIAGKVVDLVGELKMLYNEWQRILGVMSDVEAIRANNVVRQWKQTTKMGVGADVNAQIQKSSSFYQDSVAEVAGRDKTPFAIAAKKDYEVAKKQWSNLVVQAASAAVAAKAPEKAAVEAAQQQQQLGLPTAEIQAAGAGAGLTKGAFLASQLTGASGADPAQNTRERQLKAQEQLLAESKRQTRAMQESGGIVLG